MHMNNLETVGPLTVHGGKKMRVALNRLVGQGCDGGRTQDLANRTHILHQQMMIVFTKTL